MFGGENTFANKATSDSEMMKTLSFMGSPPADVIAAGESFLDYLNSDDFDVSLFNSMSF